MITEYITVLNQSGTAAPVPNVFVDTFGGITWSRVAPGVYKGEGVSSDFDPSSTHILEYSTYGGALLSPVVVVDSGCIFIQTFVEGDLMTINLHIRYKN